MSTFNKAAFGPAFGRFPWCICTTKSCKWSLRNIKYSIYNFSFALKKIWTRYINSCNKVHACDDTDHHAPHKKTISLTNLKANMKASPNTFTVIPYHFVLSNNKILSEFRQHTNQCTNFCTISWSNTSTFLNTHSSRKQ